jgi:hypothetical protein
MNKVDQQLIEGAFSRLIQRAGISEGDEPHLIFGFLAVENEMMVMKIERLEKLVEKLSKPRLIIPETKFAS